MRVSVTARVASACVIASALLLPVRTGAWGMDVHRLITGKAIDGMPPELNPFFMTERAFILERSVDPDLWRVVDLRGERGDEPPNHFLDLDFEEGSKPPFLNIPRDWDAHVQKYGAGPAHRYGRLPWRAEDIYNRLVTAFKDIPKPTAPYAADNARYLLAVLSHYIQDAHQPFHAVTNHDGQLTNQRGIHARFETEMILRNQKVLRWAPVKAVAIQGSFKDYVFKTLVDSAALVPEILATDLKAAEGREFYDDAYFAALFKGTRTIAERRLSEAASAVASAAFTAWVEAGKPVLPKDGPRQPARIRR